MTATPAVCENRISGIGNPSMFMFIGEIVGGNAWLVHTIRHLRRRCAHTIATQQEMEISLRSFPFPTVLSTIYRLRRIPDFQFPISNTPSPTDFQFPGSNFQHTVSDGFSVSRFPVPDFRFPTHRLRRNPESQFTVPGCRIWCRRGVGYRRLRW